MPDELLRDADREVGESRSQQQLDKAGEFLRRVRELAEAVEPTAREQFRRELLLRAQQRCVLFGGLSRALPACIRVSLQSAHLTLDRSSGRA